MSRIPMNSQLPPYNLPVGTLINIDGRPHQRPTRTIPGRLAMLDCHTGQPFVVPDVKHGTALPTEDDYDDLLREGRLEIVLPENVVASRALAATAEWDMSDLEAIDPGIRKTLAQVVLLDDNGVKNGIGAIEKALEKLWTPELQEEFGKHDHPATIKRWRAERGEPGNRPPYLLVRLGGKVPRTPHDEDVPLEIRMKHALERKSTRGPMTALYARAATELKEVNEGKSLLYPKPEKPYPIFSYDTFRRDCIKVEGSETVEAKDGEKAMENTMRGGGRPLTASRILEKVIIDHTRLDAFLVIDPERDIVGGRPWITFAFDVHSRAILAWVITFRSPSYWTVCETLRRMNLPKKPPPVEAERYPILKRICGKPGELILDNAAEFTSHGLEDAAKSGSFSVRFCPVRRPRYRAIGERAIKTVQEKMLENLPGHSMTIDYNRRTEHDGEELAVATPNEMEALANKAVAEYHTEPHDGLRNQQPALVFQRSANKHGIDVMGDVRRFTLETYDTKLNVKVTKSGVRIFDGLRYFSQEGCARLIDNNLRFEPRRQARVDAVVHTKIKFDPENIAVIHAWDKTTRSYVELKCQDETYADGMPLWFHKDLVDLARREATAPPESSAPKRSKRKKGNGVETESENGLRRLSELDGEMAPRGFNTEAERLAARARRIEAIRAIAPGARARERKTLAQLYDIPRVRAITGNLVSLDTDYSKTVTTDDFIAHDVSALTNLDAEILADRPDKSGLPKQRKARNDRRRGGQAGDGAKGAPQQDQIVTPNRRRRARG
ncbi:transposase family protein [Qipengyuania sp. XHP0207]|uniref:integrase catalytic domain-containing protein n=1 Tax=Qipengyuania sp. XHP0207 TaxID=3038078 RepID=UPI0024203672|nr:transposase family protein [Qipengyuania sp. XHP0207]MDG5746883.1 transposase family protein [Qipengyuania sp. XHP0207]